MKHLVHIFALASCFSLFTSVMAQKSGCRIVADNWQKLQMEFAVDQFGVGEVVLDGDTFSILSLDGYQPSASVGDPCLPVMSQMIEVPLCQGFEVKVTDAVYDTLPALPYRLVPVQPSRSKSDTLWHPMVMNNKVYSTDTWYELAEVEVEAVGVARDRNLARIQFSPMRYNPVSGEVIVCRKATVTVSYHHPDKEKTIEMYQRYHTPAFNSGAGVLNSLYPKSMTQTAPIRYLIVAHSMFRNHLDSFVEWKRRKGFLTDIVYTDDPGVGGDSVSIASYIKSQYTNATADNPAPVYLLIVGDNEQIPAFAGTTDDDHITDLYYTTWTSGDHLPDCYYGRFSAQNVSQLIPQIQKTLMYEQYTFPDPSFLDRAVMVAGVDGGSAGDFGYTHADPAMDYAIINYVNGAHGWSQVMYFKNDTSIVPSGVTNVTVGSSSSSMSATVRSYYNQGAGFINYSAHGGSTGWGTPSFNNNHVSTMTNNGKFGLFVGNCCLTNKFEVETCFGEALLRKNEYAGGVGYIGGSNSTYWGQDFYWAVGLRSSISATMSMAYDAAHLGVYDCAFHTHGESYSNWCLTQGEMIRVGNMAVESSSSGANMKYYYWEIYHLMGDPSVMTYLTQAATMSVVASPAIFAGTSVYTVSAAPYAYVALTDTLDHNIFAAGWADASGTVTLTLPCNLPVGGYELTASAQQYQTFFTPVTVIPASGPYVVLSSFDLSQPLVANDSTTVQMTFSNLGVSMARNIVVHITSGDSVLSLSTDSVFIDSLEADAQITLNILTLAASFESTDNRAVPVTFDVLWDSSSLTSFSRQSVVIAAPHIVATYSGQSEAISAGTSGVMNVTLTNNGHAPLMARMDLVSPTVLLTVSTDDTANVSLPVGGSVTRQFTIQASSLLPESISLPLTLSLTRDDHRWFEEIHPMYIGDAFIETFEGNQFHFPGWSQGSLPWIVDSSVSVEGTYCARSPRNLVDNDTSSLTLTAIVDQVDSISFYFKVSSEENYDKFHFSIDGEEKLVVSGDVEWQQVVYHVNPGSHTFVFSYTKDYSVSRGQDCAWIDDVVLPKTVHEVTFRTDDVCQGAPYVIGNNIIATDSVTSGCQVAAQPDGGYVIVSYQVFPIFDVDIFDTVCDHFEWNGFSFNSSAEAVYVATSSNGCDSVCHLHLVINRSVVDTFSVTVTDTGYLWNDSLYTQSGTYDQFFTTINGCDSMVTLLLTLEPMEPEPPDTIPDTTGIRLMQDILLGVYPNPTTGLVYLSQRVEEAVLYDATGREAIRRRDTDTLDLSTLPTGTYTLRLKLPMGTVLKRVVKR